MPYADLFTFGIMVMVAQKEAGMISARMKAALAAAKARGVQFRSRDPIRLEAVSARKSKNAAAKAQNIAPIIVSIEKAGVTTLLSVARALEARGIKTPAGADNRTATQVARVKARAA
jgi:DNA invertase Pin-like site-specific DNA recombinase